jgi:release factor glutamine methyltransferase
MEVDQWLAAATKMLSSNGIGTARLDCLVLLEDCLNTNRTQLLAHSETTLSSEQLSWLNRRIRRRAKHEPLAYIRRKTEFYGREFYIDHRVLEPRPESETIIELLKKRSAYSVQRSEKNCVIDVGTGSGALAITAKLELPEAEVLATDVDSGCLQVARKNARKLSANVQFFERDLLPSLPYTLDARRYALLCNLPYVPDSFQINPAAQAEPRLAIFGGQDGLDVYRKLFTSLEHLPYKPRLVLTEAMPPQHSQLTAIANVAQYQLVASEDFIQVFTL